VKALPHSRLHACSRWEHSGHTAPMIKKAFQRMAKYMFPSLFSLSLCESCIQEFSLLVTFCLLSRCRPQPSELPQEGINNLVVSIANEPILTARASTNPSFPSNPEPSHRGRRDLLLGRHHNALWIWRQPLLPTPICLTTYPKFVHLICISTTPC
jgi:hypothetical protein